ncbi:hypothetical protein NHH03_27720, partial [Stieleria sp. TO1_6]|uniref:hypothetical protein n=1 Tax=Stieleria tagensis TaxID=2956795 RepID=UPI00209B8FB4
MIALNKKKPNHRRRRRQTQPLRFSPYAWAKLQFLRDAGGSEVGAFGISDASDLLLIEDVVMIDQVCTAVSVEFSDAAVADFFDDQVDQGRVPEQFARIWIHTHPGSSAHPSATDENTFARCFGASDWAVMFILAKQGATYSRLRINSGPGSSTRLHREIDYSVPFDASDESAWQDEYDRSVTVVDPFRDSRE